MPCICSDQGLDFAHIWQKVTLKSTVGRMFSIDVKASVKVKAFLALRYRLLYVKACTGPKDHLLTHSGCGASPSITTWRLPVCVGMFCKVSRRESTTQKPLPLLNPGLLKRELNKPIVRLPCFPSQTFRGARFFLGIIFCGLRSL